MEHDSTSQNTTFAQALGLPAGPGVTTLVGGGGKSSLGYTLAGEYARAGLAPIVTTTTGIGFPKNPTTRLILADSPAAQGALVQAGQITCVAQKGADGKLHFPGDEIFSRCKAQADRIFVEGDGSKKRPMKAPAGHEPCIPAEADSVIAVAGLSALGQPLEQVGFRLELLYPLLDAQPQTIVTPKLLAFLLTHPQGQRKNLPAQAQFAVYLNQADDPSRVRLGLETAHEIQAILPHCRVVIGRMQPEPQLLEALS
jgi:probable selenium-dependent hydroxylase accessory protein YqeC